VVSWAGHRGWFSEYDTAGFEFSLGCRGLHFLGSGPHLPGEFAVSFHSSPQGGWLALALAVAVPAWIADVFLGKVSEQRQWDVGFHWGFSESLRLGWCRCGRAGRTGRLGGMDWAGLLRQKEVSSSSKSFNRLHLQAVIPAVALAGLVGRLGTSTQDNFEKSLSGSINPMYASKRLNSFGLHGLACARVPCRIVQWSVQ
jgi:hypothetical protein